MTHHALTPAPDHEDTFEDTLLRRLLEWHADEDPRMTAVLIRAAALELQHLWAERAERAHEDVSDA